MGTGKVIGCNMEKGTGFPRLGSPICGFEHQR